MMDDDDQQHANEPEPSGFDLAAQFNGNPYVWYGRSMPSDGDEWVPLVEDIALSQITPRTDKAWAVPRS